MSLGHNFFYKNMNNQLLIQHILKVLIFIAANFILSLICTYTHISYWFCFFVLPDKYSVIDIVLKMYELFIY